MPPKHACCPRDSTPNPHAPGLHIQPRTPHLTQTRCCPKTPHPTQLRHWKNGRTIAVLVSRRCGPGTEAWVESPPHGQTHPTSPPLREQQASKRALPVPMAAITRAQGTCLERQASFSKGGRAALMTHYTEAATQVPTKQEEHCVPVEVPGPQSRGASAGGGFNSRVTFQGDSRHHPEPPRSPPIH